MQEHHFWQAMWLNNDIPFHQNAPNPNFQKFLPLLELNPGDTLFFPLCGKSIDMTVALQNGLKVLGVELSEKAIQDFFHENNITYQQKAVGKLTLYESDEINLYQGDIFELPSNALNQVKGLYDRAALIALTPQQRLKYVHFLKASLPKPCKILLESISYVGTKEGPPFSVDPQEVKSLYAPGFIKEVKTKVERNISQKFQQSGIDQIVQTQYLIELSK